MCLFDCLFIQSFRSCNVLINSLPHLSEFPDAVPLSFGTKVSHSFSLEKEGLAAILGILIFLSFPWTSQILIIFLHVPSLSIFLFRGLKLVRKFCFVCLGMVLIWWPCFGNIYFPILLPLHLFTSTWSLLDARWHFLSLVLVVHFGAPYLCNGTPRARAAHRVTGVSGFSGPPILIFG